MSIKAVFPKVKLTKQYNYKNSSYYDKKKSKLWINNTWTKGKRNYYNVLVLITKDNKRKVEWTTGDINGKSVDVELTKQDIDKNIEIAYNYAKENNYLWIE